MSAKTPQWKLDRIRQMLKDGELQTTIMERLDVSRLIVYGVSQTVTK